MQQCVWRSTIEKEFKHSAKGGQPCAEAMGQAKIWLWVGLFNTSGSFSGRHISATRSDTIWPLKAKPFTGNVYLPAPNSAISPIFWSCKPARKQKNLLQFCLVHLILFISLTLLFDYLLLLQPLVAVKTSFAILFHSSYLPFFFTFFYSLRFSFAILLSIFLFNFFIIFLLFIYYLIIAVFSLSVIIVNLSFLFHCILFYL